MSLITLNINSCITTVEDCIANNLLFEETLSFTPATVWWSGVNSYGTPIAENDTYIFIVMNDSSGGDYVNHQILRYTKSNGTIDYKQIATAIVSSPDYHKLPAILISSSGALLVSMEQQSLNTNNSSIEIFRWTDPSDLNTYSSTVVGNTSTERLAYQFLFETSAGIILEARRYSGTPQWRNYYVSNNDGVSFGVANQYINYGDSDYWIYTSRVENNKSSDAILGIYPQNDAAGANCYQYITFLKTNFTGDFFTLDGTNLGNVVTGTELEANTAWGDPIKNNNLYAIGNVKIIDGYIYGFGYVGTRTASTLDIQYWQLFKTNLTTGVTTEGALLAPKFDIEYATTNATGISRFFNLCGELYLKISYDGILHYYKIEPDLSDMTLIYTEGTNYHLGIISDDKSEITADFDPVTNKLRVFRMQDMV